MEIRSGQGAQHFHGMASLIVDLQLGAPTHVINNHVAENPNRSSSFRLGEMKKAVLISADSNKALDEAMVEQRSGGILQDWDFYFTKVSHLHSAVSSRPKSTFF